MKFILAYIFCLLAFTHFLLGQNIEKITDSGTLALQNGNYKDGVELLKQARKLSIKRDQTGVSLYATILNNLAYGLSGLNDFDAAAKIYQESLNTYVALGMQQSGDYADVLDNLGTVYYEAGDYGRAADLIQQSADIRAVVFGEFSQEYSLSLSNLAAVQSKTGNLEQAISNNLRVLKIREKTVGTSSIYYGKTLNNIATNYGDKKEYNLAESFLTEAIRIYERNDYTNNPGYITSMYSLGVLKMHLNAYDESRTIHIQNIRRVVEMYGKNNLYYTQALSGLIQLETALGNFSEIEEMLHEELSILQSILGYHHSEVAATMNNLGIFYSDLGNYEKAADHLQKALVIYQKVVGPDHFEAIQCELNLINVLIKTGDLVNAGSRLRQIEEQDKQQQIELDRVQFYLMSGYYYTSRKEPDTALLWLNKAQTTLEENGLEGSAAYADMLNSKGVAYSSMGDCENAVIYYANALRITNASGGMEGARMNTMSNYIQCLTVQKKYDEVYAFANQLESKISFQIREVFPVLSKDERLNFVRSIESSVAVYKHAMSISAILKPSRTAELLTFDMATKGMVFNSWKRVEKAISSTKDKELLILYDKWKTAKRHYSEVVQNNDAVEKVNKLKIHTDSLEKKIASKSINFKKAVSKSYDWSALKEKLNPGEALVDIMRLSIADTAYIGLILTSDMPYPQMVNIEGGTLERKSITYYRKSIEYKLEDAVSYENFWSVIDEHLDGVKKVYLVPDGVYQTISIKSLYDSSAEKFMIDKYQVVHLTNASDLLEEERKQKRSNKNITLIGRPNYQFQNSSLTANKTNAFSDQRFVKNGVINDLPGTLTEIKRIGEFCEEQGYKIDLIYGNAATEERINQLASPTILHVATHGYFLSENESSVLIKKSDGKFSKYDYFLIRSGLLLAGAQHSIDLGIRGSNDGILTALEVGNLNIEETDLTVLSACETGLGDLVHGEGVFGLMRSFRMAGSKSLLLSLWEVDDNATKLMMIEFYNNYLVLKMDRSSALHKAQLTIRNTYEHPNFWSSFILVE